MNTDMTKYTMKHKKKIKRYEYLKKNVERIFLDEFSLFSKLNTELISTHCLRESNETADIEILLYLHRCYERRTQLNEHQNFTAEMFQLSCSKEIGIDFNDKILHRCNERRTQQNEYQTFTVEMLELSYPKEMGTESYDKIYPYYENQLLHKLCTTEVLNEEVLEIPSLKESSKVLSVNIFPHWRQCNDKLQQNQHIMQIIFPAKTLTKEVLLLDNFEVEATNYKKIIDYVIQVRISVYHHHKTSNVINFNKPSMLEYNSYSSTHILTTVDNFNDSKVFTVQTRLRLFLKETNLSRSISYLEAAKSLLLDIIIELVINKTKFVNQTALSQVFCNWYFQNIFQGLRVKIILESINNYTISKIGDNLCLILSKGLANKRVKLHFRCPILGQEYCYLNYYMFLVNNTKYVSTEEHIINNVRPLISQIDKEFEINVSDRYTQTAHRKKYQDVDTNTELENGLTERDLIIPQDLILNDSLWIPKLCGESYNNKISFMSYILQCSCLNEALVNLDVAEKYIRNVYEILLTPSFNKIFLKDLGKYLLSTFMNTVI